MAEASPNTPPVLCTYMEIDSARREKLAPISDSAVSSWPELFPIETTLDVPPAPKRTAAEIRRPYTHGGDYYGYFRTRTYRFIASYYGVLVHITVAIGTHLMINDDDGGTIKIGSLLTIIMIEPFLAPFICILRSQFSATNMSAMKELTRPSSQFNHPLNYVQPPPGQPHPLAWTH